MTVTMRDVASKANVSIKTVSRVVNHQGEISEATRQRVLSVIDELGYRPNSLARSLVLGKTQSVALLIPQITDPFFPEVVLGVESVANQHDYSVFLCNTNEDPDQELRYIDVVTAKQVDGTILCGTRLSNEQLRQVAAQHRVSLLTSRMLHDVPGVRIQSEKAMYMVTTHLIACGHRRIGYIGREEPDENLRASGYFQALRDRDLPVDPSRTTFLASVSVAAGRQMAEALLRQAPDLTALLCYDDRVAVGALQACQTLGRMVPRDTTVVGFDDISLASLVTPALTTVHVPRYRIGEMLMEALLKVIAADHDTVAPLYVQPQLIVRQSGGVSTQNERRATQQPESIRNPPIV